MTQQDAIPDTVPQDLPDAGPVGPDGYRMTDLGLAARVVALHGQDLRYCPERAAWMAWDGARWRWDEDGEITRRVISTVQGLYRLAGGINADKQRTDWINWVLSRESKRCLDAAAALSSVAKGIPIEINQLDANPWILPTPNGEVDLRDGSLRLPQRASLSTKLAGTPYDPKALCPLWDAFLAEVVPDKDVRDYLQRAIGYSLTGSTREQCLFFLYGIGANGKSTALQVISLALGDHGRHTPTDTLLERRGGDSIPNDLARLHGARFVTAVEAGAGRRLAESLVKQLTGGDPITARFLRREYFEFTPAFKLWLAANHRPVIRGADDAIRRRIHLIPFTVQIPPDKRDHNLVAKLKDELAGILRWAVEGCIEWQKGGLRPPQAVRDAVAEYRGESDMIGSFLAETIIEDKTSNVRASDVYATFSEWAKAAGEQVPSGQAFSRMLTERGVKRDKSRGRGIYVGWRLRTDADLPYGVEEPEVETADEPPNLLATEYDGYP